MWTRFLLAIGVVAFLPIYAAAQASSEPVVAFARGTTLSLATSAGEIVQEIKLNHPVYDFALSKDKNLLVTVSPDTEHGGNLTLIDLRTHAQKRLTNGHLVSRNKELNERETEVYGDLQFSPDGRSLVFGVHWNLPGDGNDAWENSGPFAVLDLETHRIHILKSTNNIDGNGPCSENRPMWSPNSKWILFSCEDGALITDAEGKTLRNLSPQIEPEEGWGTGALSWFGNGCILYMRTPEKGGSYNYEGDEARLLNLRTNESQDARPILPFPKKSIAGLIEASDAALVRLEYGDRVNLIVETDGKQLTFPYAQAPHVTDGASAHVLGNWQLAQIPTECK